MEDLPFAPVDLEGCSPDQIAELVSECQVDQSVPAVSQYTPGGSEAGAHPSAAAHQSLLPIRCCSRTHCCPSAAAAAPTATLARGSEEDWPERPCSCCPLRPCCVSASYLLCSAASLDDRASTSALTPTAALSPTAALPLTAAPGYRRWRSFIDSKGLTTYARRRNEALDVTGPSRLSAYLNTGMVSPMRIAQVINLRRSFCFVDCASRSGTSMTLFIPASYSSSPWFSASLPLV